MNFQNIFLQFSGLHQSFLWGHWHPCFGLLVTFDLEFSKLKSARSLGRQKRNSTFSLCTNHFRPFPPIKFMQGKDFRKDKFILHKTADFYGFALKVSGTGRRRIRLTGWGGFNPLIPDNPVLIRRLVYCPCPAHLQVNPNYTTSKARFTWPPWDYLITCAGRNPAGPDGGGQGAGSKDPTCQGIGFNFLCMVVFKRSLPHSVSLDKMKIGTYFLQISP